MLLISTACLTTLTTILIALVLHATYISVNLKNIQLSATPSLCKIYGKGKSVQHMNIGKAYTLQTGVFIDITDVLLC